ncbi:hypothetical protein [Eilatimonas milleporae]|uniref:Uncharacterized protein n=1 Tax=Eilatimonas milleporae TaxID=911205 RepID=A0A3M0CC31_9PROT|nr:hypothetical protein [Eilatimonas milleporae]RMB04569.1 hypothetical protein BXY39_2837 [Eilatimonas milleporae]
MSSQRAKYHAKQAHRRARRRTGDLARQDGQNDQTGFAAGIIALAA